MKSAVQCHQKSRLTFSDCKQDGDEIEQSRKLASPRTSTRRSDSDMPRSLTSDFSPMDTLTCTNHLAHRAKSRYKGVNVQRTLYPAHGFHSHTSRTLTLRSRNATPPYDSRDSRSDKSEAEQRARLRKGFSVLNSFRKAGGFSSQLGGPPMQF